MSLGLWIIQDHSVESRTSCFRCCRDDEIIRNADGGVAYPAAHNGGVPEQTPFDPKSILPKVILNTTTNFLNVVPSFFKIKNYHMITFVSSHRVPSK